jgi:hypothetical protein
MIPFRNPSSHNSNIRRPIKNKGEVITKSATTSMRSILTLYLRKISEAVIHCWEGKKNGWCPRIESSSQIFPVYTSSTEAKNAHDHWAIINGTRHTSPAGLRRQIFPIDGVVADKGFFFEGGLDD